MDVDMRALSPEIYSDGIHVVLTCVKSQYSAVNGLPYSAFPADSMSRNFHPCIFCAADSFLAVSCLAVSASPRGPRNGLSRWNSAPLWSAIGCQPTGWNSTPRRPSWCGPGIQDHTFARVVRLPDATLTLGSNTLTATNAVRALADLALEKHLTTVSAKCFWSASALLAMQTAVVAWAILSVCSSVCPSFRHIPVFCPEE